MHFQLSISDKTTMADNDNSNGLAGTPPKVPSSKSSDISIEEIVPEDADDSLTEQKPEKDEAADISKSEVAASGEIEEKGKEGEKPATDTRWMKAMMMMTTILRMKV